MILVKSILFVELSRKYSNHPLTRNIYHFTAMLTWTTFRKNKDRLDQCEIYFVNMQQPSFSHPLMKQDEVKIVPQHQMFSLQRL